MALTFENFFKESQSDMEAFKVWWMRENAKNPKHFPLELPEDNAGEYFTSLVDFMSDRESFEAAVKDQG